MGKFHGGIVPWVMGIAVAYGVCRLAWPLLKRAWMYHDFVAGEVDIDDDKGRDWRVVAIFLITTALTALLFGWGLHYLSRGRRRLWRPVEELMLMSLVPGVWTAAGAISKGSFPVPGVWVTLVPAGLMLLVVGELCLRRSLLDNTETVHALGVRLALLPILGAVGGLGAAMGVGRLMPDAVSILAKGVNLFPGIGAALGAIAGLGAIVTASGNVAQLRRRLDAGCLGMQVPAPWLLLHLMPPVLHFDDGRIAPPGYPVLLAIMLSVLALAGSGWIGWRALAVGRRAELLDAEIGTSQGALTLRSAVTCITLIGLAVLLLVEPSKVPTFNPDPFHFGETFLPWRQWVDFGQIPYVNLVPIHGLMDLLRGMLNSLFFDGTAASFPDAQSLVVGAAVAATFAGIYYFAGAGACLMMMLVTPMGGILVVNASDRFLFFAPSILLLCAPRLIARPCAWIIAWTGISAFGIFYNGPVGIAAMAATAPIGVILIYRVIGAERSERRLLLKAGAGVLATVCLVLLLPHARQMLGGFIHFVLDNQSTNDEANSATWTTVMKFLPSARVPLVWVGSTLFIQELTRVLWLGAIVGGMYLSISELVRAGVRDVHRRISLVGASAALVIGTVLCLPWAAGRLEPMVPGRVGGLLYVSVMVCLPVLVLARGVRHPGWTSVIVAAFLGLWSAETSLPQSDLTKLPQRAVLLRVIRSSDVLPQTATFAHLGTLVTAKNTAFDELLSFRKTILPFLRPGETYFDTLNRQAYYSYLDRVVPTQYPAPYVAPNMRLWERMIHQLEDRKPPVVVLPRPESPLPGASLRYYPVFKWFLRDYVPVRIDGRNFLIEPGRSPTPRRYSDEEYQILDSLMGQPHVLKQAIAWGRSWKQLRLQASVVATVEPNQIERAANEQAFEMEIPQLAQDTRKVDYLLIRMKTDAPALLPNGEKSYPSISVQWRGKQSQTYSPPVGMNAETGLLLFPIGNCSRWAYRGDGVDRLRIKLDTGSPMKAFQVEKVSFLEEKQ